MFVDKGEGYLEPRPVKVGAEALGYVAIQSGLSAGERVVTAANFSSTQKRVKGRVRQHGAARPKTDSQCNRSSSKPES